VLLKDKVVKSIKDTLKYSCSNHARKKYSYSTWICLFTCFFSSTWGSIDEEVW